MEQQCLDNIYTHFLQKRLKPTKNCYEVVNSFVCVSVVKMYHNPMHVTNRKSYRQSSSVQTTFIPIFSQKRLKPTKNCLEGVNIFLSVSKVKMCRNLMHLTNHKSQRWSRSVQTIFMPILSQKRIKPTKNCLEAANSFVSVAIVKMCHNPMHLTNHRVRHRVVVFRQYLYQFSPKRGSNQQKIAQNQ